MLRVKKFFGNLWNDNKGQGMVEYALIIGLVAVLLIGGLTLLKNEIGTTFQTIVNAL